MSDPIIITGNTLEEGYSTFIESRRLLLLKVLLAIFLIIDVIYIPINISLGIWSLVYVGIGLILYVLAMFYALRETENLKICSHIFVIVGAAWSIMTATLPTTDFSVFVWNAYVPAFTFFLLGKRRGLFLCSIYIPIILVIFFYRYHFSVVQHSLVDLFNISTYIILVTILYMYYESTRAHTDQLLIDEIEERKQTEAEKVTLIKNLEIALQEVKTLRGLLPVCSCCKKIRDDSGYWDQLEEYIEKRLDVQFSHGICPECLSELYPDIEVDAESLYDDDISTLFEDYQCKVDSE